MCPLTESKGAIIGFVTVIFHDAFKRLCIYLFKTKKRQISLNVKREYGVILCQKWMENMKKYVYVLMIDVTRTPHHCAQLCYRSVTDVIFTGTVTVDWLDFLKGNI